MQSCNINISTTSSAASLVLSLGNGVKIIADKLVIINTPKIIVTRPWAQPDPSVPCIHLIPPTVINTARYAEDVFKAPFNTAAGAQSKVNEEDSFTTLVELSERPVNYELAVQCPLEKCLKFGPVNDLSNHYILAHANHDYTPDADEELGQKQFINSPKA